MSGDEDTSKSLPSTSETNNIEESNEQNTAVADVNTGALEVAEDKTSSDEYIRLRVITSDMTNEVHFRVKASTPLVRLKRSYCSKLGFRVDELRFVFDGHRITDDDTPKKLGMINDDVIEIYQERTGGGI
ncbi:small ubiquitin-related modifier-like [Melanaphis sacchari]|uniref:small ubiquitin-related modifier-like n=1 Tax=Melanaphis sacchari TaxID=742174 RepID=UPI000DC131DE|nr:small ubiquitin-related modifier-like [Melanaphis sacchari]XP_025197015.1 small ubiquitin-related modifier-like [Melanaphis sacchari]